MSSRVALSLIAAIAIAGCDRAPTSPARHMTPPVTRSVDHAADAPITQALPGLMQSVTGHYELIGQVTNFDYKYSFSAIRHEDGSVSGEIEERTTDNATGDFLRSMHATVTCFTIIGRMAFLAGIVDRVESEVPGQELLVPGAFFRLNVVDNGNGDDPPDLGSNVRFGDPRIQPKFCDNLVPFNLEPIQHGNITVRP
jgi:hypothetical protein